MDIQKRSPSAKHCGSSRSVLQELSISTSLLSSCLLVLWPFLMDWSIFYGGITLLMFVAWFKFISSTNPISSASTTCPAIPTISSRTTNPTWMISVRFESIELQTITWCILMNIKYISSCIFSPKKYLKKWFVCNNRDGSRTVIMGQRYAWGFRCWFMVVPFWTGKSLRGFAFRNGLS